MKKSRDEPHHGALHGEGVRFGQALAGIVIIRVDIEEMTGKQNG